MIIDEDKSRNFLFKLFVGLAILILILSWTNNGVLTLIDTQLSTELLRFNNFFLTRWLFQLFAWTASFWLMLVALVAAVVLLWQQRFKIPAIWLVGLQVGSWLLIFILSFISLRPGPMGMPLNFHHTFPNLNVWSAFNFVSFIYIVVLPELRPRFRKTVQKGLYGWLGMVMLAVLVLQEATFTDVVGVFVFGYAWELFTMQVYRNCAPEFLIFDELADSWI